MDETIIFHNPRCSKSRATLALLREKGIDPDVIDYVNEPPAPAELKWICSALGIKPVGLIRANEERFKELGLSLKDDRRDNDWIKLMHENPILIERPIVIHHKRAALGRPPENILKILD